MFLDTKLSTLSLRIITTQVTLIGLAFSLVGCDFEQAKETVIELVESPTADAGANQSVSGYEDVTLNGIDTAPDGESYTYQWTQLSGDTVTLQDEDSLTPSFTAPMNDQALSFRLTATSSQGFSATDEVEIAVDNGLVVAPSVNTLAYVSTDQNDYDVEADCPVYEPNWYEPGWDWSANPRYEFDAGPVVVVLGDDYSYLSAEEGTALTALQTDPAMQQNLIDNLLEIRRLMTEDYKISISNTVSNDSGKCYRTSMFVNGTVIWNNDTVPTSGAGTSAYSDMIPYMEIPHAEIIAMTADDAPIQRTIPHEFLHAQQFDITRGYQEGWWWYVESYAMFFANGIRGTADYLPGYHFLRHWAIDSAMTRYNSWPFWMFLADRYGYEFTADILQRYVDPEESALEFIKRIAPFDCSEADANCRSAAMANLYADFANSTVNYGVYSDMLNIDVRSYALDTPWGDPRVSGRLEQVAEGQYRIPDWLAPQRFAHNIIRLIPDPDSEVLSITLDGWDVPERGAEWRATVVATLDDSTLPPEEASAPMFMGGTQHINLSDWEAELGKPIQRLELVVAAVPSNWKRDQDLPAFSGPYRGPVLDRYVYELKISGAWPQGHEPQALREAPGVSGAVHANGGGFVADTASVAPSAYVDAEARILGSAQVLGNARIEGRAVISGSAVINDQAIVSSDVHVGDTARVDFSATARDGVYLAGGAQLTENGKMQGDGYYYGGFTVSGQGVALGSHINTITQNATITGTAISNGHGWIDGGSTIDTGTPYEGPGNYWSENDQGLFMHYDFSAPHPYRVKDIHVDSDAYYLDLNGAPAGAVPLQPDTTLSSSVLELTGTGYLSLPKWLLDQTSYNLQMKLNWQGGGLSTQTLLEAATERGERVSVQLVPIDANSFDLRLQFVSRDGVSLSQSVLLSDTTLTSDVWLDIALLFDDASKELKITTVPVGGGSAGESALTIPYATREFDYDTLDIRVGAAVEGEAALHARLDEIMLYR